MAFPRAASLHPQALDRIGENQSFSLLFLLGSTCSLPSVLIRSPQIRSGREMWEKSSRRSSVSELNPPPAWRAASCWFCDALHME